MFRSAIVFLFTLSVFGLAAGQTPVVVEARSASHDDVRRDTFEQVWRTIRDKHFDPTLGGLDWNKIHEKYEPRLATIKSDDELYTMLQQMIGELGQTHFNIIPPSAVVDEPGKAEGEIGVDVDQIGGDILITKVLPDSPAAAAGIRPGYVVRAIDGKPIADRMNELADRLKARKGTDALRRLILGRLILHSIDGAAGSTVTLQLLDEKDQAREFKVVRAVHKTEMSPALGNFPPQPVDFESRRLADNIGYIRFNIWVIPMMEKLRTAIRAMGDASGLILDLRGNPGGVGGMASGLAGLLSTQQFSLGTMKMRSGEQYFTAFPQPQPFTGPVVILTDSGSASTSEVFAAGMQETKRATVVGEQTAGAALPSVFEKLPTGAIFQYAIGDFKTPGGVLVEGRGVIPDVQISLSRTTLLAGYDAQLEVAVQKIRMRIAPTVPKRPF